MILVTGATGTNGRELLKRLSAFGVAVRAMVRKKSGHENEPLGDVRDIAAVAAEALTRSGHEGKHEGKIYDITGPESLTHAELAAQLSQALGKEVTFVDIPELAMRSALLSFGFPEWQADGLIEDYAHYRRGEASAISSHVHEVTGRPPHTFLEFARDYRQAFIQ